MFGIAVILAIILPLGIGTGVLAALGLGPQRSGDSSVSSASVVEGRQAAVTAAQNTGFLSLAASDLADGVGELNKGAGQLQEGIAQAAGGAQQLSGGMQQLQSGTAEIGAGATQMADGVEAAAQGTVALKVVRGQMLENLNALDKNLAGSQDPNAQKLREDLAGYKAQLQNVDIAKIQRDLNTAKEKSRELANQLTTPGFAYYDGVVSAAQGASSLSSGLGELQTQSQKAFTGIKDLNNGAQKVAQMAKDNQEAVNRTVKALPAAQLSSADAAAGGANAAAASTGVGVGAAGTGPAGVGSDGGAVATSSGEGSSLSTTSAMLIAGLVLIASMAVGAVWALHRSSTVLFGGLAASIATGTGLVFLLAQGLQPLAALGVVLAIAALSCLTVGVVAWWVDLLQRGRVNRTAGIAVLILVQVLQLGIVAWAWTADTLVLWGRILVGIFPLNYATGAVSVLGNAGDTAYLWTSAGVLGVLAAVGIALLVIQTISDERRCQ